MKRFFLMSGILFSSAFLLSSFSLRENPQDPPRGEKKEKHIKVVKIDEDGKKMELDTILTNNDVFIWNGDTIGGDNMKWFSVRDFVPDSIFEDMDFDFDMKNDGEAKIIVLKSAKKGAPGIYEFESDGDSTIEYMIKVIKDDLPGNHKIMVWRGDKGDEHVIMAPKVSGVSPIPPVPPVPPVPGMHIYEKSNSGNVIDLSDPGIISYKKKKMSGGREKITIIRNQPDESEKEKVKKIIIDSLGDQSTLLGDSAMVHKVIVTKTTDGKTEVLEDGKTIRIKEAKEGDEKNIEVEIEENQENN